MANTSAPRSLRRLMRLFEVLAEEAEGMTLTELSTALDAPKTSLLNLLPALVEDNYLDHTNQRYNIGPAMFVLAGSIVRRRQFTFVARPTMSALVEDLGETAALAVLDKNADVAVYIDSINSSSAINYTVTIGQIRPLYATNAGKVLLAYQPDDYVAGYLAKTTLTQRAPRTITSKDRLQAELKTIREQGWSVTVEESSEGVAGFAAPIFDHNGVVLAALTVGGPAGRVMQKEARCRDAVRSAAARISKMMGYPVASASS